MISYLPEDQRASTAEEVKGHSKGRRKSTSNNKSEPVYGLSGLRRCCWSVSRSLVGLWLTRLIEGRWAEGVMGLSAWKVRGGLGGIPFFYGDKQISHSTHMASPETWLPTCPPMDSAFRASSILRRARWKPRHCRRSSSQGRARP